MLIVNFRIPLLTSILSPCPFTGKGCPKDGKGVSLYYRQTCAVNLLIEIEGKDIGHAADEINDSHEAGFEIVGVDVVLAADTTEKLLGVETLWVNGCLGHLLHKGVDDAAASVICSIRVLMMR